MSRLQSDTGSPALFATRQAPPPSDGTFAKETPLLLLMAYGHGEQHGSLVWSSAEFQAHGCSSLLAPCAFPQRHICHTSLGRLIEEPWAVESTMSVRVSVGHWRCSRGRSG